MTHNNALKQAQPIAENASLMKIHLWEAKCSRNVSIKPSKVEVLIEIETTLLKSETQGVLPFGCTFKLVGSDKSQQKQVFEITISFCVIYKIKENYTPADGETKAFGLTNVIFNAWPYVRELVQNLVIRMDLPAFVLPTITIGKLAKMAESPEPFTIHDSCGSNEESRPDIDQVHVEGTGQRKDE